VALREVKSGVRAVSAQDHSLLRIGGLSRALSSQISTIKCHAFDERRHGAKTSPIQRIRKERCIKVKRSWRAKK
jgi:hypothetical protein